MTLLTYRLATDARRRPTRPYPSGPIPPGHDGQPDVSPSWLQPGTSRRPWSRTDPGPSTGRSESWWRTATGSSVPRQVQGSPTSSWADRATRGHARRTADHESATRHGPCHPPGQTLSSDVIASDTDRHHHSLQVWPPAGTTSSAFGSPARRAGRHGTWTPARCRQTNQIRGHRFTNDQNGGNGTHDNAIARWTQTNRPPRSTPAGRITSTRAGRHQPELPPPATTWTGTASPPTVGPGLRRGERSAWRPPGQPHLLRLNLDGPTTRTPSCAGPTATAHRPCHR